MILTREQVELMTDEECRKALKQLFKDHRMETPWHQLTKEEWAICDDVGNTMLWLEDRIKQLQTTEQLQQANMARWGNHEPKVKTSNSGPKRKQFRIGETIYIDVQAAALKTGVKVATLRQYVTRKPDIYAYID